MKDYKVQAFSYALGEFNGKTKPKYFQTRVKADEYAETLLSTHQCCVLHICIWHRGRQSNFWSAVRCIDKSSTYCVVSDYPE